VLWIQTDFCSDPDTDQDPASQIYSDANPALEPNRIRIRSDPDPAKKFQNILKSTLLPFKKCFCQLIYRFRYSGTKFTFKNITVKFKHDYK